MTIQVLELNPNDLLLVKVYNAVNEADIEAIRTNLVEQFKKAGMLIPREKMIVLGEEIELSKIIASPALNYEHGVFLEIPAFREIAETLKDAAERISLHAPSSDKLAKIIINDAYKHAKTLEGMAADIEQLTATSSCAM